MPLSSFIILFIMSLLRLSLSKTCNSLSKILNSGATPANIIRPSVVQFSTTPQLTCQAHDDTADSSEPKRTIDPAKDRSIKIDVETSIRYLQSATFKKTYGDSLVWQLYRRNHKGGVPPKKTRRSCIVHDMIRTGSPCPICRDQYLVLHHTNLELLHQFISPYTGEILSYQRTNLCQRAHRELIIAFERAHDRGLIQLPIEFRWYNYADYYKSFANKRFN